jgi:CubicO group peptidase (beta-lactamase class C family)
VGGTDGTWRGSAGVHDLESGAAADPDARFRAGSTTKVVTAATVLRLAAQGKVDLDTPVQHYLPGLLTKAFEPISVRQLLNHTSGIQAGDGFGTPSRTSTRTASTPSRRAGRGVGGGEGARSSGRASGRTTSTSTTRSSAC